MIPDAAVNKTTRAKIYNSNKKYVDMIQDNGM